MTELDLTTPSARMIKDSISPQGHRLSTIETVIHRPMLPELNTHRKFSRNSASSRAIPFWKQKKQVLESPALPVKWATEQSGMQGGDPLGELEAAFAQSAWLKARDAAVEQAQALADLGVHKSIVNRLIEPYMYHRVILSSTEWENFFRQRCSPLAQPEIEAAANCIRAVYEDSTPVELGMGEWHTPYILDDEKFDIEDRKKISAARCARVSYLTHDGVRDPSKDLELFERLTTAEPPHASPLEHVATPSMVRAPGNFDGWRQLRHDIVGF